MSTQLDIVLQELYLEFDTPADRVLSNPILAESFYSRASVRLDRPLERETVFRRLLNLRKKGALPRLRRK